MTWSRRKLFVAALVLTSTGIAAPANAQGDAYPSKPIKLIVPFTAGGPGDVLARLLADKVGAELGQRILVDNRTGGNGIIGTDAVAKSEPDGYTILQMTGTQVVTPHLQSNIPYDLNRDLVPVVGVGAAPTVLVVPGKSGIRSLDDLAKLAKSSPNGINFGSGSVGSIAHLTAALLVQQLNIKATHVPYRGSSLAVQAIAANEVQFFFPTPIEAAELAKSGDIRMIAVNADQRLANFPDVPTMKELGMANVDARIWYGYYVPARTPPAIIDRLYKAFAKVMSDPAVTERIQTLGFVPKVTDAAEFGKFVNSESARWKKVIDENQIKAD